MDRRCTPVQNCLVIVLQPQRYRDAAHRLTKLSAEVRGGVTGEKAAAKIVAQELESLAGDRSTAVLQQLAEFANKIRSRGTESPEQIDIMAAVLLELADLDDEAQAESDK